MNKKILYNLFLFLFFSQINSFNLITTFNSKNTKNYDLKRFKNTLEKNLNHFLIDTIYIFYVNPPEKLPNILNDKRIKIISINKDATFKMMFDYANSNLEGKRIIITSYDVYFDDSLFKLNYYPMDKQFMCLSLSSLALDPNNSLEQNKSYDSWIFKSPTTVTAPKDLKWDAADGDIAVQIIASNTDDLNITNPSLDVFSYKIEDQKGNKQFLNNNINKNIVKCSKINIDFSSLEPFKLNWELVKQGSKILLYDRNMYCNNPDYCTPAQNPNCYKFACVSLNKNNSTHLIHDLANNLPLPDNSVDVFQTEDVLEHRPYDSLVDIINEVCRVLKPGGLCRISMPDYRCDVLYNRSIKDNNGSIIFDPLGGGQYQNGKVVGGGHLWFPNLESVTVLLSKTLFNEKNKVKFLHYYTEKKSITKKIDYSICYVRRTPDHDGRVSDPYRAMSIVVDLIK